MFNEEPLVVPLDWHYPVSAQRKMMTTMMTMKRREETQKKKKKLIFLTREQVNVNDKLFKPENNHVSPLQ